MSLGTETTLDFFNLVIYPSLNSIMSVTNIPLVFTSFRTIFSVRDIIVFFSGGVVMGR